jgi:hypothetical protein
LSQFSYFNETITTKNKVSVWFLSPLVVAWQVLHGTLWTVKWDNYALSLWEYPPYELLSNFLAMPPLNVMKFAKLRSIWNVNYYPLATAQFFLKDNKKTKIK